MALTSPYASSLDLHSDLWLNIDPSTPQSLFSDPPNQSAWSKFHIEFDPGMVRKGVLVHDVIMQN